MKTLPKHTNILGTIYKIEYKPQKEMQALSESENANLMFYSGLCDFRIKTIYIDESIAKKYETFAPVLRHEMLHAFCYESGNGSQVDWATNESCIDYYAIQMPKIFKAMHQLGIEK